jgi:hypothetical protein
VQEYCTVLYLGEQSIAELQGRGCDIDRLLRDILLCSQPGSSSSGQIADDGLGWEDRRIQMDGVGAAWGFREDDSTYRTEQKRADRRRHDRS